MDIGFYGRILLYTIKVDANIIDNEGQKALAWATKGGYQPKTQMLLDTSKGYAEGRTVLILAAPGGHEAIR